MNNVQNTRLRSKLRDDRKNSGKCSCEFICKILHRLNIICSFMGISLFAAIFFGHIDIFDCRNSNLIWECAQYLVIASVTFFIFGLLVSYIKEDSKQNKPFIVPLKNKQPEETSTGTKRTVLDHTTSIGTGNSNLIADNLQFTKSNIEIKLGTSRENIKPTNPSSKSVNLPNTNKKKMKANFSGSSNSSKNLHSGISQQTSQEKTTPIQEGKAITLSSNLSPEIHKHAGASKQEENVSISPLNISSKALQHASTFKQGKKENVRSRNISPAAFLHIGPSKQGGSAGNLSPNASPKFLQQSKHEKKESTKSPSQSFQDNPSRAEQQLVPYNEKSKLPPHIQSIRGFPMFPSFRNFMPNVPPRYISAPMLTTTETTAAPWRIDQEELCVRKWTYHYKPRPEEGTSSQYSCRSNIDCDQNRSFVQEFQISQATSYQYPRCATGVIPSQNNLDYNLNRMSTPNEAPQKENDDTDLRRSFEFMSFLD